MFFTSNKGMVTLIQRDRENYEVRIWSPRKWGAILVLCVAFALFASFWTVVVVLPALGGQGLQQIGLRTAVLPILAMAYLAFIARGNLLTETVAFRNGMLVVKRDYIVFRREESFSAEEVEHLRAGGLGGGTVEFRARGRTRYVRSRLREQTARTLVEELNRRVQDAARR